MIVFPLSIGFLEILLIAFVVLLLVGGNWLPKLLHRFGKGVGEVRRGMENDVDDQPNQAEIDRKS